MTIKLKKIKSTIYNKTNQKSQTKSTKTQPIPPTLNTMVLIGRNYFVTNYIKKYKIFFVILKPWKLKNMSQYCPVMDIQTLDSKDMHF